MKDNWLCRWKKREGNEERNIEEAWRFSALKMNRRRVLMVAGGIRSRLSQRPASSHPAVRAPIEGKAISNAASSRRVGANLLRGRASAISFRMTVPTHIYPTLVDPTSNRATSRAACLVLMQKHILRSWGRAWMVARKSGCRWEGIGLAMW